MVLGTALMSWGWFWKLVVLGTVLGPGGSSLSSSSPSSLPHPSSFQEEEEHEEEEEEKEEDEEEEEICGPEGYFWWSGGGFCCSWGWFWNQVVLGIGSGVSGRSFCWPSGVDLVFLWMVLGILRESARSDNPTSDVGINNDHIISLRLNEPEAK